MSLSYLTRPSSHPSPCSRSETSSTCFINTEIGNQVKPDRERSYKASAGIKMTDAEQSMVPNPPKVLERVKSALLRARQR